MYQNKEIIVKNVYNHYNIIAEKYNINKVEVAALIYGILSMKTNYYNTVDMKIDDINHIKLITFDKDDKLTINLVDKIKKATIIENNVDNQDINLIVFDKKIENAIEFKFIEENLIIRVDYNNENTFIKCFAIAEIEQKLLKIIEFLCSDNTEVIKLDILTEYDKKIYEILNNTDVDYKENNIALNILIDCQCIKNPNKVAVIDKDISYTYEDIFTKSNEIANLLYIRGIKKGDFVSVIMNKSIELIISLYAIMKVGAAFVPIDIKWPLERILSVLKNTNDNIVLVDEDNKKNIANEFVVRYDKIRKRATTVDVEVNGSDYIYAIFTSGSTGIPKGAINKHEGIVNRLLYMNKRYNICSEDVILFTANHAFDSSVWQMFWPLINGNTTVIPNTGKNFDIMSIINSVYKYKITITDFVPSVFNLLVSFVSFKNKYVEHLNSLRQLLIGGEEMNAKYIYLFKKMYPNCSITNTYGPAEASIGTVFFEIPSQKIEKIPIGRPIDNVKTFICDINENVMPINTEGILYLGGKCVGAGYINNIEMTKKVFKNKNIGGKEYFLYKTGDIVKINENIIIEFLGRIDSQVKINGVRIELKEIESKVLKIKEVSECNVICVNKNDKKIIVVFYISNLLKEEDIRNALINKLPKAMMPHQFIRINKMPITFNGKVDTSKLIELVK